MNLHKIASRVAILLGDAPLPGEWPNGPATGISEAMIDITTGARDNIPSELIKKLEDLWYIDDNGITEEGEEYMRSRGIL